MDYINQLKELLENKKVISVSKNKNAWHGICNITVENNDNQKCSFDICRLNSDFWIEGIKFIENNQEYYKDVNDMIDNMFYHNYNKNFKIIKNDEFIAFESEKEIWKIKILDLEEQAKNGIDFAKKLLTEKGRKFAANDIMNFVSKIGFNVNE